MKPSSEKSQAEVWNLADDIWAESKTCSCTRKDKHLQLSCPGWKSQFPRTGTQQSSFALDHQFPRLGGALTSHGRTQGRQERSQKWLERLTRARFSGLPMSREGIKTSSYRRWKTTQEYLAGE